MKYKITVLAASCALIAACNTLQGTASANDNDTDNGSISSGKIARLNSDIESLRSRINRNEDMLSSMDGARMALDLEQVRSDLSSVRGQLEEQQNELNEIKRQQREFYVEVDNRLRALEGKPSVVSSSASTSVAVATPRLPNAGLTPATDNADQVEYQQALQLVRGRKYDAANKAFVGFLQKYPSSPWAGHAQYWLAETYYVNRDYDVALDQFSSVIANYPNSNKVPSALLKKGYIYYEKRDWANARSTLEQVTNQFPKAGAAKFAARRLARMKEEGH